MEVIDRRCQPRPADVRAKISVALKGRKIPAADLAKRVAAQTGLKRSPEFSERLSKQWKGRTFTPEHRQKLRLAKLGKKLSAEHRAKLALAQQKRRGTADNPEYRKIRKTRSGFEA